MTISKNNMKLFGMVTVFIISCNIHSKDKLLLNQTLPSRIKIIEKNVPFQNAVNGFTNGSKITCNDIEYFVALDANAVVKNIITFDSKFTTPEGIQVGTPYKKIDTTAYLKKFIPGLGLEVYVDSGWIALFSDAEIIRTGKITDTSKIRSIYKPSILK